MFLQERVAVTMSRLREMLGDHSFLSCEIQPSCRAFFDQENAFYRRSTIIRLDQWDFKPLLLRSHNYIRMSYEMKKKAIKLYLKGTDIFPR